MIPYKGRYINNITLNLNKLVVKIRYDKIKS